MTQIGISITTNFYECTIACMLVNQIISVLQLVEVKVPDTRDMFELFCKACFADGCEAYANV